MTYFHKVPLKFGLLCSVATFLSQSVTYGAKPIDEARALVQLAIHREEVVLNGIRWSWRLERGKTKSQKSLLSGEFDSNHPVDRYNCRWLANDGIFLYESIAQQPVRKLGSDDGQQIVMVSDGSKQFLFTQSSQLVFEPQSFTAWNGGVSNETHGLSKRVPSGIPLHAGMFGLDRVKNLLGYIDDTENTITLESGTSIAGFECRVLRINKPASNSERIYYFDIEHLGFVQYENLSNGKLRFRIVVIETQLLQLTGGDDELPLPKIIVSLGGPDSDGSWKLTRFTSEEVKLEPVPLSEMVVLVENPKLYLHPWGKLQKATDITKFTPENLDSVVARLFEERVKYDALVKAHTKPRKITEEIKDANSSTIYIFLVNLILLLGLLIWAWRKTQK